MEKLELISVIKERFLRNVHFTDECWAWKGALSGNNGYGVIKIGGKNYYAHRASYLIYKGEIEKGLLVCHICDNQWCVNPDHLWLGDKKSNAKDAVEKGRWNTTLLHSPIR